MNLALPKPTSARTVRRLLAGGVVGPLLFMAAMAVEGAFRPGYSAMRNFGSQLATSSYGWQQIANFLVLGLIMIGFAAALRQTLRSGIGATWLPRLVTAFGAGLLVAGVFPTDPAYGYPPGTPAGPGVSLSWHGAIHGMAGFCAFTALTAASFIFAARSARLRSIGWMIYSATSGILLMAFFVASWNGADLTGLYQRIAIVSGWGWLSLFALHCLRNVNQAAAGPSSPGMSLISPRNAG